MGSSSSGGNVGKTIGSHDNGFAKESHGFSTKIHAGKQGKHILGHNNFQAGKGIIHGGLKTAQNLISAGAGTGVWHAPNRETVDFKRTIGVYVSLSGERIETSLGTIHYSKTGAHIVPSKPRKKE